MWFELLLFVLLISYLFYKWATINNDFFSQRNVKHLKPKFLVGNNEGNITSIDFAMKVYESYPDEP